MHYSIDEIYNYKDNDIDLEELNDYLKDIFDSIGEEIHKITKTKFQHVENNWRHKANPCLMQTLSKIDKGELLINYELNKITSSNYKTILETIKKSVNINSDKYVSILVVKLFNKILTNELYLESHMKFLIELKNESTGNFTEEIKKYYRQFIDFNKHDKSQSGNMYKRLNNDFYVFGCMTPYFINNQIVELDTILTDIGEIINSINCLFEWEPIDIKTIEYYIYMLLGIHCGNNKNKNIITKIETHLKLIIKNKKISMKLKFHILNELEKNEQSKETIQPKVEKVREQYNKVVRTNEINKNNMIQKNEFRTQSRNYNKKSPITSRNGFNTIGRKGKYKDNKNDNYKKPNYYDNFEFKRK